MKLKGPKLSNLKIGRRLALGLGAINILLVLIMITSLWSLGLINSQLERIIKVNNAKTECAHMIRNAIDTIDKSILTIVLSRDENLTKTERGKIDRAREAYEASLKKLEGVEVTEKGKELTATIRQYATIAAGANDRVIELASTGAFESAAILLTGSLQVSAMLDGSCEEMVKFQTERTAMRAKEASATNVKARLVLLIVGAFAFVLSISVSSFLARSIVKPLSEGVTVANRIAEGDLAANIEVRTQDETGQLLGAMKHMVANLRHVVGEVKNVAGDMAKSSQQLNSSSELMSKGAGEQASKASQVATASEQMSQTVLDIAKNTSSMESSATGTARLASDGEEVVVRSVDKVKAIAVTIDQSAQLIRSLGDQSEQIGAIISVINDIADQTNLLALNAAIEAARAGDAGGDSPLLPMR